jgi:hypothetical protein
VHLLQVTVCSAAQSCVAPANSVGGSCSALSANQLQTLLLPVSASAQQVGAIRTQSHYIQHKMGPVTCMAWHPYNLYLGAAGNDSVASVYIVDNVPTANPGSGVSYAPTTVSSAGLGGGGAAAMQQQSASLMSAAS